MKICVHLRLFAAIVFLAAAHAETLDRIAVSIGTAVIAESDVLREIRVAAFLDHKTPDFILQEASVSHLTLPTAEVVQSLLDHTKEEYGADYGPALKRCFLTEQDLVDQLLQGLRTIRFTEMRFRPEVLLSNDELTDYYTNTLVAKWKRENLSPIPSFEESRATVERLLTDERMMQSLDRWLGASRTERRILYREDVFK
jgi:hypothetical protein